MRFRFKSINLIFKGLKHKREFPRYVVNFHPRAYLYAIYFVHSERASVSTFLTNALVYITVKKEKKNDHFVQGTNHLVFFFFKLLSPRQS